jgi:signal transduction histidine kinase
MGPDGIADDLRSVLADGGESGALIASLDWASSPLGPMSTWPERLRAAVAIVLRSPFPKHIAWGPELIQLYNDAYRPILGSTKHPAIGAPVRETFGDIFETFIRPRFALPLDQGVPYTSNDEMFVIDRHGWPEEMHFAGAYSPLDDGAGGIAGVFTTAIDITDRVVEERRMALLSSLSAATAEHDEPLAVVRSAVAALVSCVETPAVVAVEPGGGAGRVVAASGIPEAPTQVALSGGALDRLVRATATKPVSLDALGLRATPHPSWPYAPRRACVLAAGPYRLVVALHPGLAFNARYRRFLELVAEQVSASVERSHRAAQTAAHLTSLQELDAAKDVLLSDVSHELRTPLALISGTVSRLRIGGDLSADEQAALLEMASRNITRLSRLVDSLLSFGQLAAGQLDPTFVRLDLTAATRDVCASFAEEFRRVGVDFVVELDVLPGPMYAHPHLWDAVVINLLSNAYKFTPEGSVTLSLRDTDAGRARLEVADTGVGIPAAQLDRLFDRFYRVRQHGARTQDGAGVGLALVSGIVEEHGWSIEVRSEPGRGSTFVVDMPYGAGHLPPERVAEPPAAAPDAAWNAPADAFVVPSSSARVLLVEDSEDLRQLIETVLGKHWLVRTAGDGHEALAAIDHEVPDVVITDARMPRMDGPALVQRLREDARTTAVPIVLLTGYDACHHVGCAVDAVLQKPFDLDELTKTVATLLEGSRPEPC